MTQIYYLITPDEFSALHKVKTAEEVFHFYLGDPVEMLQIDDCGKTHKIILGNDLLLSTLTPNLTLAFPIALFKCLVSTSLKIHTCPSFVYQ